MTPGRMKNWNALAGAWQYLNGGSQPGTVQVTELLFSEDGDGVYVATLDLPANSYVMGIVSKTLAEWTTDSSEVILVVGDSSSPTAWTDGLSIASEGQGEMFADFQSVRSAVYTDDLAFYPDATTLTFTITQPVDGGATGRTLVAVFYATGIPVVDAVKS